ncbi:MAG: 23S rRNA (uracil(1939)-C(5))-methyltransferase RlmD [Desulfopila sp.]|jgi:23S rRNA (uracil1939-C5)-methyltransferase|nr:23S rRNA (uracil(1939)-C(5))-methyltransferase RlmD [Desulfopila sp.]
MKSKTILVEKMVNGGYGLARLHDGQVILLQNSLPGEEVLYSVDAQKKKTLFGRVDAIVSRKNSARVTPPCPYYGRCGGCDLQHCSYPEQVQLKKEILEELFAAFPVTVPPFVPSPEQFGYRQRIRLQLRNDKIGFYAFRSREIAEIEACLLAHPLINTVLREVSPKKEFHLLCRNSTAVEFLYNPATESVTLLFHYLRPPRPSDTKTALQLTEKTESLERIFFQGEKFPLHGPFSSSANHNRESKTFSQTINDRYNGITHTFLWEVGGFCQVNLRQNQQLVDYVIQKAAPTKNHHLLDLFCGMGNFSIPLAHSGGSLTGVESQGAAIRCAAINSMTAGLKNTEFIKGHVDTVCARLKHQGRIFDTTLVDPPRQGLTDLPPTLAALASHTILYISCDPSTLVRDVTALLDLNFQLVEIQPFDMFPQTHHIETVVILEKN